MAVETERLLIVMLQSSLRDIAEFLDDVVRIKGLKEAGRFVCAAIKKIVFQGGACEYHASDAKVVSHWVLANNKWDKEAAQWFWDYVYQFQILYDAVSNSVTMAAALDLKMLADLPGPMGAHYREVLLRLFSKFAFDPYYGWEYMPHLDVPWFLKIRCGMTEGTAEFERTLAAIRSRKMPLSDMVSLAKVPAYNAYAGLLGIYPDGLLEELGVLHTDDPSYHVRDHGVRDFGAKNMGGLQLAKVKEFLSIIVHYGVASAAQTGEEIFPTGKMEYDWDRDDADMIENTVKLMGEGPDSEVARLGKLWRDLDAELKLCSNVAKRDLLERVKDVILKDRYWVKKDKIPIAHETAFRLENLAATLKELEAFMEEFGLPSSAIMDKFDRQFHAVNFENIPDSSPLRAYWAIQARTWGLEVPWFTG
ncbi:hypothetical protein SCP_1400830 [Sparassis crispa]|uniref:Uncharacterized protein n=1 Tax=Sparassis crispa TaxID=139825 RepID=A0A401H2P5_9APHY|nr:hypothetical protein SCP_1400830 [Sparassis crispa]GBE88678.1 hypothetical protein SCP_1400830 [Sparassis crispa]